MADGAARGPARHGGRQHLRKVRLRWLEVAGGWRWPGTGVTLAPPNSQLSPALASRQLASARQDQAILSENYFPPVLWL